MVWRGYRFGFNGKEVNGELNDGNYDFGARNYDGRVGRWWSVDPYKSMYPNISPYAFALNSPIKLLDENGGYVVDENGNIIFVPTGDPKFYTQGAKAARDEAIEKVDKKSTLGHKETANVLGYYAQEGYIFADDGTKVKVKLVTNLDVYNATEEYGLVPVYETVIDPTTGASSQKHTGGYKITQIGLTKVDNSTPVEEYVASPNCAGECMLDGKFVLHTYSADGAPAEDLLSGDGYEKVEAAKQGDVGLYYFGSELQHVEGYEDANRVSSNGGILQKSTNREPKTTWKGDYTSYEIQRRISSNRVVSSSSGTVSNGVRSVTKGGARKVRKQIKKQMKNNKK